MSGSPLKDFAKRHKSDFPESVGTGQPQPCSTAGETEAELGSGENPPVWWLCPQNACILPRERSLPSWGRQLPPSQWAPAWSSFAAEFWHGERQGKKKKEHPCWQPSQPKGRILDDRDMRFVPISSHSLMQPQKQGAQQSWDALSCQQPLSTDLQLWVLLIRAP